MLVAGRIERDSIEETARGLHSKAVLLRDLAAPYLSPGGPPAAELELRIQGLGREIGARLTVIAADGGVLADSDELPERMENHLGRPEIVAARQAGRGEASRYSDTVKARMLYSALQVGGDPPLGYVRTSLPLTALESRLADLRGRIAVGAVTAALIALALGFFVARGITGPLGRMTGAVHAIAAGDYTQKVPVDSTHEFGELAGAFNAMAGQLQERMQTILTDRNKLAAVLASMAEGVIAVDRDERIVHLNEAARKILRLQAGDLTGHKIWEATRTREVCDALAQALGSDGASERELRLVAPPRDLYVKLHASPLRGSDGQLSGAVVIIEDITDLRRLEEVRRDFVANVSHELKTPLTAIRGLVETLLEDPAMDEATRMRFLEKVHRQGLRLSQIVVDLLTLSRAESDGAVLDREHLDLREPALESARVLRASADDRRIQISVEACEGALPVKGDYEVLRQAIDNLLDNAIKYTPPGGQIWLRLKQEDRHALVEVQDTGIGIDPVHQKRIFERFYRVDKARSRELGGTGLGLSIVKHIALALGGRVSLESFPGRGSTFRIHLPLAQDLSKREATPTGA
ncbi:MAG: cell wall metabolism sensor histidine kinase WalK [Planctomycetota bacterium]|nr:cell wall metabolism sensor histidine kinase WalK [Planctomycetota bacterium]